MGRGTTLSLAIMKLVALFLLSTGVSAEWTCDDCKAASELLATYTTTDDALDRQNEILVADLCPQAPDPEKCVQDLPGFWDSMAIYIFPGHYKHLCDDMECPEQKAFVPNCEECSARINAVTDYLGHDDVIAGWVKAFQDSEFCPNIAPDNLEECKKAVDWVITHGLPVLVASPREWVDGFCTDEFGCTM